MKTAEPKKTDQNNDLGYAPLDARALQPHTDHLLVQWELCNPQLKLGKFTLSRPDTHTKMHYTGTVIAVGPLVSPEVKPGCRIVFDQFSDPDKYFDEYLGRVALLKEEKQGQLFMIVSPRTLVDGSEQDYNYNV